MASRFVKLALSVLMIALAGATLGLAVPVPASLTFNDLKIGEEALNFYNGGLGSLGTGPGPDFGVSFTSDFVTASGGVIFPDPSLLQSEQLASSSGTMNVLGGFSGLFSFYYTARQNSSAELFSGLNGTGSMVGIVSLPVMSSTPWFPAGSAYGPFASVVFNGSGLAVDNVTFGGGLVVPEPVSVNLLPVGLIFLLAAAGLKNRNAFSCNPGRSIPPGSALPR